MKLEKTVKITENRYDCNIRTITTTWCGFNDRGEWIWHSKVTTAYPNVRMLTLCWYKDTTLSHRKTICY